MAVKNNIDVFYFSVLIPLNIFFVEDGKMGMNTVGSCLYTTEQLQSKVKSSPKFSMLTTVLQPEASNLESRLRVFVVSERQVFLATWKDIPNENELQYQIKDCHLNAGKYQKLWGGEILPNMLAFGVQLSVHSLYTVHHSSLLPREYLIFVFLP